MPTAPLSAWNWRAGIRYSGRLDGVARSGLPMVVGVHPGASDGFDVGLDFAAPPPPPDDRIPVAYLQNLGLPTYFRKLIQDLRPFPPNSDGRALTWTLVVANRADDRWTLEWDMSDLPGYWTEARLSGEGRDIDMRASTSLTIPAGGHATYELVVATSTPWDLTGNGTVDIRDLVSIAMRFGESGMSPAPEDLNDDGRVNIVDLVIIARHFGERR